MCDEIASNYNTDKFTSVKIQKTLTNNSKIIYKNSSKNAYKSSKTSISKVTNQI